MKSFPEHKQNGVNGTHKGAALGKDRAPGQGTPGRHPTTVPKRLKFGTWNVKTLIQAGKLENLKKEMERMEINILGIAEMRWPGSACAKSGLYTVIYSGKESSAESGVGIIISERLSRTLLGYIAISDRVVAAKFNASPFDLFIIQVYAPTALADDADIEKFYHEVKMAMKEAKSRDLLIVMGDFNAKIGKGGSGCAVGDFGLGERNDRGDIMAEWAETNQLVIANTWFPNHKRKLYTWISPGDRVRNQIDFICVQRRYRNAIRSCRAYPGADCDSDHVPVVAICEAKLKNVKQARTKNVYDYDYNKMDTESL